MRFLSSVKQRILGLYSSWSFNKINVPRAGEKINPNIIVNKIAVQPIQRASQDIQKWRSALIMAEGVTQQRDMLYNLYEDCLLDGYLDDALDKRRYRITNLELTFTKENKPVDAIIALTKTTYFEKLLQEIINAKFYGHSLVQLDWSPTEGYKNKTTLIPRRHVKPRFGIVVKNTWDTEGINYLEPPFDRDTIEIGDKEDLGKLLRAAPLVIFKRGGWGDWAEFCESFGMPIIDAAYNNDSTRDQLEKAFANMGSRGRLIRPSDAFVDVKTINENGAAGDLYDTFRKALNEELSITILGNTMTTTEAAHSGYAQSKTHQHTQEQIHKDDRKFTLRVLNEKLIPYLKYIGYPAEGGTFSYVESDNMSLTERLNIDLKVSQKVLIADKYWYDTYKIPMPTDDEKKAAQDKNDPDIDSEGELIKQGKKPKKKNQALDYSFFKKTKRGLRTLKIHQLYSPHTEGCDCNGCKGLITLADGEDVTARFKKIDPSVVSDYMAKIHAGSLTNTDVHEGLWKAYYSRFKEFAEMGFGKRFKYDDPDVKDVALGQKIQHNLSRFATYKQQTLTSELKALKYDKNGKLLSLPDFEKKAEKLLNRFNVTYLKTELNHVTQAAQMADKWREIERTAYLYPNLKYVTANDERVRESHRPLNNVIRPINDPFWKTHYPPNGWGCRCKVVRTDAERTPLPEGLKANPKGFNQNVGLTGQIFDDEHPYFTVSSIEKKALDIANSKLEFNTFDTAVKKYFDKNTGGYMIDVGNQNKIEIADNIETARMLMTEGYKVILLPVIKLVGRKNPDALLNGTISEFKILKTPNAKNSIPQRTSEASEQGAEIVIMRLDAKTDLVSCIKGIYEALKFKDRKVNIKILKIELPNGRIFTVTRQEVEQRTFEKRLNDEWQKP